VSEPSELRIIDAGPDDVEAIWQIKRAQFPPEYLVFSVYHAPAAFVILERILGVPAGSSATRCRVARVGDQVVGYTLVGAGADSWHLSYIAAAPGAPAGTGRRLLDDFHDGAARMRVAQTSLDVFMSNHRAVRWYLSEGYAVERVTTSATVDLSRVPARHPATMGEPARATAESEARRVGAAPLRVEIQGSESTITLLGTDVIRLGDAGGLGDAVIASALAPAFPDRPTLALLGRTTLADLPYRVRLESARMVRGGRLG
jgi:ribosomal protein S18 acetylase RimI-like enzyme